MAAEPAAFLEAMASVRPRRTVALFVLIQAIPYGRDHPNPPVLKEPAWDSPQHVPSRSTPASTVTVPDELALVHEHCAGFVADRERRQEWSPSLNFSEWNRPQDTSIGDIVEAVQGGSMPPAYYAWMPNHPGAKLSKSEKAAFIRGLEATFKASPPIGGGGG